jgi:CheY-like chemotaxis protein
VIKILLIEADPDRAAALAAALGGGATEVRIAPDGFYALTMMERERPDVVVAGGCVGGIGAGELGAIVRSDPMLAGVRLARYADPAAPPADFNGGGAYDLVLDAAAPARELAESLRRLAGIPAAAAPRGAVAETGAALPAPAPGVPRDARPIPSPAPLHPSGYSTAEMSAPRLAAGRRPPTAAQPLQRPQPAPDLSGSLGVLDLMELSQAFSLASKTGQLFLDCSRGEGCIYFELGRVIHATIRERTGREAFSEILQATLREQNLAFRFAPREPHELAAVPRSIDLTVQHLLLSFAVDFDETQGP